MIDILRKKLPLETYKKQHRGVLRRYFFTFEEKGSEELLIAIPLEKVSTATDREMIQKMNHFVDKDPHMGWAFRNHTLMLHYRSSQFGETQADELIYELHDTLMILKDLGISGRCIHCGEPVEDADTHGLCNTCEKRREHIIGEYRLKPFSLIAYALFTGVLYYLISMIVRQIHLAFPIFSLVVSIPALLVYRKTGGSFKRPQRVYLLLIFILCTVGSHLLMTTYHFRTVLSLSLGEVLGSLPYLYFRSSYSGTLLLELGLYIFLMTAGFYISFMSVRRTEKG